MKLSSYLILMLALLTGTAGAAEEKFAFEETQKRILFQELINELRCPKCQNQNIADSDAMIAQDLQRKVYQLVQEGKTKEEVIVYMKQRYGEFVHYKPPLTVATIWLWLLPVLVIIIAFLGLKGHAKGGQHVDQDKLAKANALLNEKQQGQD